MFKGREKELSKLNELYKSNKFQFAVIWGRRRVGKTTLINEFCKDKKTIFFSALEDSAQSNLKNLSKAINENDSVFENFENAFDEIAKKCENEKIIFVIDEFPYLAKSFSAISSLLQQKIDLKFKDNPNIFLILCGSSMSFMENQVLGYESPLYGRRTCQFKILPFDFYDSSKFFNNFSKEELAIIYGLSDGIPQYLLQFDDSISVKQNIINQFLTTSGFLFEEPSNLLKQELREPQNYNAIITAIANGASQHSKISTKTNFSSAATTSYLEKLIELGIIEKKNPVLEENAKPIYSICDTMFRFWYSVVPQNISLISQNKGEFAYNLIEERLNIFMGKIFEKICEDYLWKNYEKMPVFFTKVGSWWGGNPKTKRQEEIDLIAANEDSAIFCECKWKNQKVDCEVIEILINRSSLFHFSKKFYFIFSKSGFTEECKMIAEEKNIKLISYEDIL